MSPRRPLLAAGLLALAAACRTSPLDKDRVLYAPHEAGLVLSYENPSLEGQARADERLQVRVEQARPVASPEGAFEGTLTYTRLRGQERLAFLTRDGGLRVVDAQNHGADILPAGFPERTQVWGDRQEVVYRVLGRGVLPHFDRFLPRDFPKVGVWVEGQPAQGKGPRTRSFLLPDLGTAEVQEWRDGAWVVVMRLTGRGFDDAQPGGVRPSVPVPAPAPAPAKAPAKARKA
ncbi:MAG: hypothetical protein U0P81_13240 [Holophagaceae bacterium]